MKKMLTVLFLIIFCATVFLTGCSENGDQQNVTTTTTKAASTTTTTVSTSSQTTEASTEPALVNNTYKTGLPIVEEKITLDVAVIRVPHQGPYAEMALLNQLEEDTNIHSNYIEMPAAVCLEKISLMFASQDFPDIMWRGPNDQQIMEGAASGLVVKLDQLIADYAPNWSKIFNDNVFAKNMSTMPDGSIYSFPYILQNESGLGMRDVWFLNKDWLEIMDLEIPRTIDQYFDVLMSFKEGIANGKLPSEGIPWLWRYNEFGGGQNDFFTHFGVLVPGDKNYHNPYMSVKNGKVVFAATDPGFKEAIKELNRFYTAGLIPAEVFTDDVTAFGSKVNAKPSIVGSYHSYSISDPELQETYMALEPLESPNGKEVKWRQQTNSVDRHYYTIFSNNKYPEASVRIADLMATEEYSIQGIYGMLGTHIIKTDKGYSPVANPPYANGLAAPLNFTTWFLPKDLVNSIELSGANLYRAKNYEVYKPYIAPLEEHYPRLVFTGAENDEKALYETDILGYISEMQADWIVNGGIDDDWDTYLAKLEDMQLTKLINVYQKALDNFLN